MTTIFKPYGSNFHAHADSSLDVASSVKKIVKRAKELQYQHVVLTEHGNLNSAADLGMCASDAGISYSHGIEAYLDTPFEELGIKPDGDGNNHKRQYSHVTILFKTRKAYQYFCRLTPVMESRAVTRWGERKPILKWDELVEIGSEIILGSGCLNSLIGRFVRVGDYATAERAYQMCRSVVSQGSFFLEIFPHAITHDWKKPIYDANNVLVSSGQFVANECICGHDHNDIQRVCNEFLISMAEKYGDPTILSEDSHFAYESQSPVQNCVAMGTLVFSSKGLIPIEDIHVLDKVLTHLGNWKTVNAIRGGFSDKDMVKIIFNGSRNNVITTVDHLYYVPEYKTKDIRTKTERTIIRELIGYKWKRASDLSDSDYVLLPRASLPDCNDNYIVNFEYYLSKSVLRNNLNASEPIPIIKNTIVSKSFAYTAGLFVGDGCSSPQGNWSIEINHWNSYGLDHVISFLKDLLHRGFRYPIVERQNTRQM